ncbi:MAG: hypothetical protein IKJ16_06855 [Agathobacter sp.]|nr:hypothetical protein [Agathobacter sp.]
MGIWGTGINSNDTAVDVIDACKEIYPFLSSEEADKLIINEFNEIIEDEEDDEYANFWYAYANWQWEHGVLPEKNKSLVIRLLELNAGMSGWLEDGTLKDIEKRRNVLGKLKMKLMSEQPPKKGFLPKIKKPKHLPGTIIIFKTKETIKENDFCPWRIQSLSKPEWFDDRNLKLPQKLSNAYDAQGKYLAALCVGIEKEPYSKYLPDLFHEHSIYSFYDYCGREEPTINDLKVCGFLPNITVSYSDFNRNIVDDIAWTYSFVTMDRFTPQHSLTEQFIKLNAVDELERFHLLLTKKKYSDYSIGCFTLQDAFEAFFEEKLRFLEVGITIDTLIDYEKGNPKLISPTKYNEVCRKH